MLMNIIKLIFIDIKLFESDSILQMKSTITLTFGDVAENHVRMERIGKMAASGFSCEELMNGHAHFSGRDMIVN